MRKATYAATVAVAAVLAGGVAAVPAQAATAKEMKVCWTSPTGTNYPIKVVLDGPTSRSKWLASGECKAWNVKRGEYKVVWANLDDMVRPVDAANTQAEHLAAAASVCGPLPADTSYVRLDPTAYVKRFKNDYVTREVHDSGVIKTTVQKNRQTRINFRMHCELNFGGGA